MSDTETKVRTIVQPFSVQATHPRLADMLLQAIPNCKLRSEITPVKEVLVPNRETMTAPSGIIPGVPRLPGMIIHVNPAKLTYRIVDPMHGDVHLCKKVLEAIKRATFTNMEGLDGVPPMSGKLDRDRMKTLCRELTQLIEAGEMTLLKGGLPTEDDIEKLPGEFLLNPGSRVFNTQPAHEKDLQAWTDQLSKVGG